MGVFISVVFGILWLLVYPIAIGLIADAKGRSFIGYFFLSIFLTPIFALFALIILGRTNRKIVEDEIEKESIKAKLQAKEKEIGTPTAPESASDDIETVPISKPDDNDGYGVVLGVMIIIIMFTVACLMMYVKLP